MADVERDEAEDKSVVVDEKSGRTKNSEVSFKATSPVRLDQLTYEARNALNGLGISAEGDPANATKEAPVRLFVAHADVASVSFNTAAFLKVAGKHKPDQTWVDPDSDASGQTVDQIKAKLANGEQLTPDEMSIALRSLLS